MGLVGVLATQFHTRLTKGVGGTTVYHRFIVLIIAFARCVSRSHAIARGLVEFGYNLSRILFIHTHMQF